MESASEEGGYAEQVSAELVRVRDALDDLRRRPIPLDADTLRHVVTASLSEANAPPPNLLVTAIRRLDRVDARLESIETALGGPAGLPRGGGGSSGTAAGRTPAVGPSPSVSYMAPPDAEAIAEALSRRLAGALSLPSGSPVMAAGNGATTSELIEALRPLVPEAARAVLRRAGREPSPQAVEVLQQTALAALEEAAASLGRFGPPAGTRGPAPLPPAASPDSLPLPPSPPPPPPLDVEALAGTISSEVARAVAAELRSVAAEAPARRPEPPDPPPPLDPKAVADAVMSRLAQQPPPTAVVSPVAMTPLLAAVGNVEAAVARLAEPQIDVRVAVDRLEAGIEALARALEEDRTLHVEEVRRSLAAQGEHLERSTGHVLTALVALADNLEEQSAVWRAGFDQLASATPPAGEAASLQEPSQLTAPPDDVLAGVEETADTGSRDPLTEPVGHDEETPAAPAADDEQSLLEDDDAAGPEATAAAPAAASRGRRRRAKGDRGQRRR